MANDIEIFDRKSLTAHRGRAHALAARNPGADFLFQEVADRMQDRLADIQRGFENAIDLGGRMQGAFQSKPLPEDSDNLELEPATYDLITSNLCLHWAADLPGVLVQINKALKPDGLMLVSMFGGETLSELREVLLAAETEIMGGANMRVSPMADVKDLGSLLQRAGFALPVADMDTITVRYEHPLKLMQDLRLMGETNALQSRARTFLRRDVLMRACDIYFERFAGDDGRVPATFQIMYLTGWHPHESQQQPLKPGSAKMNLADALGKSPPKR